LPARLASPSRARSKARAGRGKSCFEAEARRQEAVHGHVNFLVCVYASVNQSDKADRPEEFSAASASEATPSGASWSL
jgi:hypothetical protein